MGPRGLPAALLPFAWQWPGSATLCQRAEFALLHGEIAKLVSLCMDARHPPVQLPPHSVPWPWGAQEASRDPRGPWYPVGWFIPLAGTLMKTEPPY